MINASEIGAHNDILNTRTRANSACTRPIDHLYSGKIF
jgi:hypothetical protein